MQLEWRSDGFKKTTYVIIFIIIIIYIRVIMYLRVSYIIILKGLCISNSITPYSVCINNMTEWDINCENQYSYKLVLHETWRDNSFRVIWMML